MKGASDARGSLDTAAESEGSPTPTFEYKTEGLASMVGRDKLRADDLESTLKKYRSEGWELVKIIVDPDVRDKHVLVFKRATG